MLRLLIILLLFLATPGMSQIEITWKTLTDVRFTDKYSEEEEAYYYYPHFGSSVKALEGKEVFLTGYMLTIEPKMGIYILSRNPFAACFFCGKGGPESIVELKLKPGHSKFKMDQVVTIKGKFKLNQDDLYQCNYILEEAEAFKPD
ncbi:MAG: DUF3299 domain-containing protein [Cytophagales bacterium]|nr:DUF3299 domain-containing protein [Cytophagales bacterium]